MKGDRLSVEAVEDAALESLFQRGVQLRLYVAPFILLTAMTLLAWDPAPWRLWVVVAAFSFATVRLSMEFFRARRVGIHHTRLAMLLPVPATVLMLVVSASGGVDSPFSVMLPMVTVFLALFLRPRYGFIFAGFGTVLVGVLTLVA